MPVLPHFLSFCLFTFSIGCGVFIVYTIGLPYLLHLFCCYLGTVTEGQGEQRSFCFVTLDDLGAINQTLIFLRIIVPIHEWLGESENYREPVTAYSNWCGFSKTITSNICKYANYCLYPHMNTHMRDLSLPTAITMCTDLSFGQR